MKKLAIMAVAVFAASAVYAGSAMESLGVISDNQAVQVTGVIPEPFAPLPMPMSAPSVSFPSLGPLARNYIVCEDIREGLDKAKVISEMILAGYLVKGLVIAKDSVIIDGGEKKMAWTLAVGARALFKMTALDVIPVNNKTDALSITGESVSGNPALSGSIRIISTEAKAYGDGSWKAYAKVSLENFAFDTELKCKNFER